MDKTEQNCPAQKRATKSRDLISLAIQDGISEPLRALYRDLEAESLPDHLLDLLKRLDTSPTDEVP
jgi:Anti-sigma factor NepR